MASIATFNKVKVTKAVASGVYVDCEQFGELKISGWEITDKVNPGDLIEVFLLNGLDGKPIATMRKPMILPGENALLKVSEVVDSGALLEWGMPLKLFVPISEQQTKMVRGYSYVVHAFLGSDGKKILGSSKLDRHLATMPENLALNQEVSLLICDISDLGYRAIINGISLGFIYNNDIYGSLKVGEKVTGYIKNIREDGRVDLYLQKPGYEKISDMSQQILEKLKASNGFIATTDKSPAEKIAEIFGMSKKNYKKAVGGLYRLGLVTLHDDGIRLTDK